MKLYPLFVLIGRTCSSHCVPVAVGNKTRGSRQLSHDVRDKPRGNSRELYYRQTAKSREEVFSRDAFCIHFLPSQYFEEVFGFFVREKHEFLEMCNWEVNKIRSSAEIICGEGELCQHTVSERNIC
jgi:hypothetical protein